MKYGRLVSLYTLVYSGEANIQYGKSCHIMIRLLERLEEQEIDAYSFNARKIIRRVEAMTNCKMLLSSYITDLECA